MRSFRWEQSAKDATGIEVIQDPHHIKKLYNNLVQSALIEIALFLPTTSAFQREEKIGIFHSLHQANARGVKVRILTPSDEKLEPKIQAAFGNNESSFQLRRIRHKSKTHASLHGRTKILVVDSKEYLLVELKDDSKDTFVDAVRLAIYSMTESTVKSYLTLFDSLWEQAELYDQLEVHHKLQKEFINIAAHELRTPMQPIIGLIELLKDNYDADRNEYRIRKIELDILARNAKRLERLATDILEVSRIESNTFRLSKELFDLNDKIRNVISDFDLQQANLGRRVEIRFKPGDPLIVEADKTRIFEVLSNLIRNAIRFTDEGTISIDASAKGEIAYIKVIDTGMGIDPEIMPKLFEKFMTTSGQGTGLGLYLSKNIIEAHGGRIWAENNKDARGATFTFTLPLEMHRKSKAAHME